MLDDLAGPHVSELIIKGIQIIVISPKWQGERLTRMTLCLS